MLFIVDAAVVKLEINICTKDVVEVEIINIALIVQQFVSCEESHGLGARGLDLSGGPDHGGSEDLSRYARASPLRWGKRTTGQVSVQIYDHITKRMTKTFLLEN